MAASRDTSLPRASPNPPRSMKSRCMSMTTSAVRSGSNAYGYGCASTSGIGRVMAGHRATDDLDVGARRRCLVHQAAVEHDQEAVGQLQQLVEVLAHQEHGGARVAGGDDPVVDL